MYEPNLVEKRLMKRMDMRPWQVIEKLKNKVSFFGIYCIQDTLNEIEATLIDSIQKIRQKMSK